MTGSPIKFRWDGEAMVPASGFWSRRADAEYVIGEIYPLEIREDRSSNSHRHYFACINDAWSNLPELDADRFPTAEHLRKFALIKAGYHDERSIVCATKAEAQRVAAFVKPMDEYAVVIASEATVKVYTAKSQSTKAMGKKAFQASKEAVLGVVAEMVGVGKESLARQAGMAA